MKSSAFFFFVLAIIGCSGNREMQPLVLDPPESKMAAEDLDFKTVNERVFKLSCVSCHSETAGNSGEVNLETYDEVFKHIPQIKMEVSGGLMPPQNPLSASQSKLLAEWIDAGAKEKAGDSVAPAPPVPPAEP